MNIDGWNCADTNISKPEQSFFLHPLEKYVISGCDLVSFLYNLCDYNMLLHITMSLHMTHSISADQLNEQNQENVRIIKDSIK